MVWEKEGDFGEAAEVLVSSNAYGLVKKARKKGPDGHAQGEEVVIKYIIKSRILADCWRRHRVLGPIPEPLAVGNGCPPALQPNYDAVGNFAGYSAIPLCR